MTTLLAINWSQVGVQTVYFILAFSILVVLHEMGHFLPAKWFKCRVEKFYLFFNPWFSLAKKKIGETEWGLGWVPFGGYVKISGMIDESMDKEQMKLPPEPYEFRAKPAWQRLIIMLGGVTVNVILAIVIFIFLAWAYGDKYLPPQNATYGLSVDSLGRTIGLQDGDIITKINKENVKDETRVPYLIITKEATSITVLRNGNEVQLNTPASLIKSLNKSKGTDFADVRFPAMVGTLGKGMNAEKAGIKEGDKIISINGVSTPFASDLKRELTKLRNYEPHHRFQSILPALDFR